MMAREDELPDIFPYAPTDVVREVCVEEPVAEGDIAGERQTADAIAGDGELSAAGLREDFGNGIKGKELRPRPC